MIRRVRVNTFQTKLMCGKCCDSGEMIFTGSTKDEYGIMKFEHCCDVCGRCSWEVEKFPQVEYEEVR